MELEEAKALQQMLQEQHELLGRFGEPTADNRAYGDMLRKMYTEECVRDPDVTLKTNTKKVKKINWKETCFKVELVFSVQSFLDFNLWNELYSGERDMGASLSILKVRLFIWYKK